MYGRRRWARRRLLIWAWIAIAVGSVVLLVPLAFADEKHARGVTVAVMFGVTALAIAVRVSLQFADDAQKAVKEAELRHDELLQGKHAPKWGEEQTHEAPVAEDVEAEGVEQWPEQLLPLGGVDLREAELPGAELRWTELVGARLDGADLHGANLQGADLTRSVLRRADLRGADLTGANLAGARLEGARLEGARLEGAYYDNDTRWPEGIPHPTTFGARHVEELS